MKGYSSYFSIGITLSLLIAIVAILIIKNAQIQPRTQQDIVLEKAIEYAQSRGLQGRPTKFVMKQTTLSEWFSLVGFQPGADAIKVGLNLNRAIWIVVMKGDVEWRGPGRQTDGLGNKFDNISIALSADTLEYIGAFSAGPHEALPLGGWWSSDR